MNAVQKNSLTWIPHIDVFKNYLFGWIPPSVKDVRWMLGAVALPFHPHPQHATGCLSICLFAGLLKVGINTLCDFEVRPSVRRHWCKRTFQRKSLSVGKKKGYCYGNKSHISERMSILKRKELKLIAVNWEEKRRHEKRSEIARNFSWMYFRIYIIVFFLLFILFYFKSN